MTIYLDYVLNIMKNSKMPEFQFVFLNPWCSIISRIATGHSLKEQLSMYYWRNYRVDSCLFFLH